MAPMPATSPCTLPVAGLEELLRAIRDDAWRLIGPRVREGAIVYDDLESAEDLPIGWTDHQEAGKYRLERRDDAARFGYAVGPHSWKKYLFPPTRTLFRAARSGTAVKVEERPSDAPRTAFIGVRACELAAIAVQDKVFLGGSIVDPDYKARRESTLLVAVNCGQAGGTCFCVSMNTGPQARRGHDIVLTEILKGEHRFLAESGSERGAAVLARLESAAATAADLAAAQAAIENAASHMGRSMDAGGVRELLQRNTKHERWNDVAARCLTCTNCTMVCPTCFCSTVEDLPDLTLEHVERVRRWDSCFTYEFSHINGGSIRQSVRSRYRQWMVHKLSTWHDQFGTSGCVGCGRCITWCPRGIDITEEVRAIHESEVRAT
jgi:ferredoxin